jgi:hypothetical protein
LFDGIHNITKWFGVVRNVDEEEESLNKWNDEHIDLNANSIKRAFFGCEYIIEIKWQKIFKRAPITGDRQWAWDIIPEFKEQFMHPYCKVGDHVVVAEMRGVENDDEIFVRNEFGGDAVFVGTNNKAAAVLIALKYK